MEASLRPHRGGSVLALGIMGLVPILGVIPFGIPAWVIGSKDLRGMDLNQVDTSGRKLTQAGRVCGIVGTVLWLMVFPTLLLSYGGRDAWERVEARGNGLRSTTLDYPGGTHEARFEESRTPDGLWEKEGHSIRWARNGTRLEEGGYANGKRTGPWTFWNEDGSVDHGKSGVYENDVKIRDQ